jgi:hypothetical protein
MAEAAVDQFSLSPEELEGIETKNQPEQKQQKPKPVIMATKAHPGALMPGDFEGLYRLAHIIYHSGFCPKQFTSPEQVFVAIQMGNELGFKPMQSVQGITVINGQPSVWGDTLIGLVEASGQLEDLIEHTTGTFPNEDYTIKIEVKRRGKKRSTIRTFSVADAKTAGLWKKAGPWTNYPKRMVYMRARAWALRDTFSDVLRGLSIVEEAIDNPVNSELIQDIVAATIAYGAESEPPLEEPETKAEPQTTTAPEPAQEEKPETEAPEKEAPETDAVHEAALNEYRALCKKAEMKSKPGYTKWPYERLIEEIQSLKDAIRKEEEAAEAPLGPSGESLFEKPWEPSEALVMAMNQIGITDIPKYVKRIREYYGEDGKEMQEEIEPNIKAALSTAENFKRFQKDVLGLPV